MYFFHSIIFYFIFLRNCLGKILCNVMCYVTLNMYRVFLVPLYLMSVVVENRRPGQQQEQKLTFLHSLPLSKYIKKKKN